MRATPTILIVEDNPITRKMLRVVLETDGYTTLEAPDGAAALALAGDVLPDLVLQDLILPDMDGVDLLRRLRALPGGRALPILALSGFLSRLEESPTGEAGFTALLVKPIDPRRLIAVVETYFPKQDAPQVIAGHGRRLLIVDDDPVQLKLTHVSFTQLGFDVAAAPSAAAALASARSRRPDIILSDVFMPGD